MRRPKNNCKPTSKKCLTPSFAAVLALWVAGAANAAIPSTGLSTDTGKKLSIESVLRADLNELRQEKKTDFRAIIDRWDTAYGKASAPALRKIALDSKSQEADRYVAILAHTRIQGADDALIDHSLGEKSWMVRSAGLKSAEIVGPQGISAATTAKILAMLEKDPALVIRTQSIDALVRLHPAGTSEALIRAAMDAKNYRPAGYKNGRADWVPQHALEALRELKPEGQSAKLLPLLTDAKDARVRAHALYTIEALENRSLKKDRPFAERVQAWKQTLRQ